ncbi:hypothetical protein AXX12_09980 [Anaerosporomusa subterranea]|uniref:Uncharacterized protein n=1 Tax=Anaerosporomusa subterranea TaxID=1794912 RepID=A0A154BSD0_ANASB|nr:hypothetical protein [Anaerosporomusa subterranea]KYZ76730.1 hypothetical protein AXX12_09980 [Anaerosporomusa subterranea]
MIKQEGIVRRNDLNLRVECIGLETEIYQIDTFGFVIYCANYKGDFEELAKTFDYSIRQIGTNVVLTDQRLTKYLKKIDNIPLSNVVSEFNATCVTKSDLDNFIRSKFYAVDISNITIPRTGIDFEILIEVSRETEEAQIEIMTSYLLNSDLGTDKITIKYENNDFKELLKDDITKANTENEKVKQLEDSFKVMQLSLNKDLPFMINEADLWFEHAEDIYTGKMIRNDLYFYRGDSLKCFLDFSVFDNIDLRNVLLLYDTVYIALPIEAHLINFLEQQNMTISDLIELVDMGKVILFLPNLETRYDKNLLLEVYKCNPTAIVGRRGINTLLASYLAETKYQYEKRLPGIYKIASDIYMKGVEQRDFTLQNIARLIAWPITATADSFRYLNQNSPMAVSNFGINNVIYENIKNYDEQEKISFELTVNSLSTHIATALQSTYFPFQQDGKDGTKYSDAGISNILGDFLKLYWYDSDNIENINNYYHQSNEDFLKLFECKHNIKISKVASLADEYNTQRGFRDLLVRLSHSDEKLRKSKIKEYNDLLFEVGKIQSNKNGGFLKFMLGSAGFLPLNYELSFVLSLIGIIKDKVDDSTVMMKLAEMKAIEKCIKDQGVMNPEKQSVEDIYLLDKISRVAILK